MNVKAALSGIIPLFLMLLVWGLWESKASLHDNSDKLLIRELIHDGNHWISLSESVVESNRRTVVRRFAANPPHELISETCVELDPEVCNDLFKFFRPLGQTSFDVCLDDSRQERPACVKTFLGWLDTRSEVTQSQ